MRKKFVHSKKKKKSSFKLELLREHSYGRDSYVYESSLRNVISLNGLAIILSLSHTQLDAYDLLGTPEQLLSRKKKKYKLFSFISWVKPSCWQWILVFFLSTVGFCFSGILNYTLYTLPRIYMLNQYFQLINVWKTSTSVAVDAGREVSCPSHLVLQKWVLR